MKGHSSTIHTQLMLYMEMPTEIDETYYTHFQICNTFKVALHDIRNEKVLPFSDWLFCTAGGWEELSHSS